LSKLLLLLPISKYGSDLGAFSPAVSIDVAAFLAVIDFDEDLQPFSNSISDLTKGVTWLIDFQILSSTLLLLDASVGTFLYSKEQTNEKRPFA
jgi:hypothetical protein